MGLAALWIAQATFSVLLAAAGVAGLASNPRSRRAQAVAALAILPLLTLHGVLAWQAAVLRVEHGVLHAPWRFAVSLFTLHLVASIGLFFWARTGGALFGWSRGRLAFGAFIAAAFSVTTLRMLDLEARLSLAGLRSEAGRIAFELVPAAPDAALDAAPIYERAGAELFEGEHALDLTDVAAMLSGEVAFDAENFEVQKALERGRPRLDEVRVASRLPYCRGIPKDPDEVVTVPRVAPWFGLNRLLCLDARMRAAQGDVAGAIDDCEAAERMSVQLARMPALISLLAGSAVRTETLPTLLHVASLEGIRDEDLVRLDACLEASLAALCPGAIRMDEAYVLAMLGSAIAEGRTSSIGLPDGLPSWLTPPLYGPFLLREDLDGYRKVMQAARAESELSFEELARLSEDGDTAAAEARSHGVLASYAAPNVRRVVLQVQQNDARVRLARLALRAERERRTAGSYPTQTGAWSVGPDEVRVEGDGRSLRILRENPSDAKKPLEVRLPAP